MPQEASVLRKPTSNVRFWFIWMLSRCLLLMMVTINRVATFDIGYYFDGVFQLRDDALQEYPAVGVWPLNFIALWSGENRPIFYLIFIGCCLLLDALFFNALLRHRTPESNGAIWYWIAFGVLCGHVFLFRLDIYSAVAVGFAALYLFSRPQITAFFLGLATLLKLWPGVLAACLVGSWRKATTWMRVGIFAGTIVGLSFIVIVFQGLERFLGPLNYQSDRGLQVESIAATPYILAAYFYPERFEIIYAPSKSMEIFGPGVGYAVEAATMASYAVIVFAFIWALWSLLSNRRWSPQVSLAFFLVIIFGLMVTNKVFSPQYIIWFAPAIAVALLYFPKEEKLRRLALITLPLTALTWYIFPYNYGGVTVLPFASLLPPLILAFRNAMMVYCFYLTIRWFISSVREQGVLEELGDGGVTPQAQRPHQRSQPNAAEI